MFPWNEWGKEKKPHPSGKGRVRYRNLSRTEPFLPKEEELKCEEETVVSHDEHESTDAEA